MKIMIVDDAVFMRKMLRDIIEKAGHTVVGEASDGQEAVLRYKDIKPDCVTMDITMPIMDGITAVKHIVANDPGAYIMVCSAMGQAPMVKEAVFSGASDFIVKPFQTDRVRESLKKACEFLGKQ